MRLRSLRVWFQCAVVTFCMLILGHFIRMFLEYMQPYITLVHMRQRCVIRDEYSRLRFIRIRICGGLDAYARTNKSQLQPQPKYLSQISPFASDCQQNVCWTQLTMHRQKAGVTCCWWKKDESFQRRFMSAKHAEGMGNRRKIINPPIIYRNRDFTCTCDKSVNDFTL